MTASLERWWVAAIYIVGNLALGMHLWHGVWSFGRSLGVAKPTEHPLRRRLAPIIALTIWLGFSAVPVAILLRVIR